MWLGVGERSQDSFQNVLDVGFFFNSWVTAKEPVISRWLVSPAKRALNFFDIGAFLDGKITHQAPQPKQVNDFLDLNHFLDPIACLSHRNKQ